MKNNSKSAHYEYTNKFTKEELTTYSPKVFEDLRKEWHLKPLDTYIKEFKYPCKFCGGNKERIMGTNIYVCKNPDCKGFQVKNNDGEVVNVLPSYSKIKYTKNK